MPQPPPYIPQFDFSNYQTGDPDDPLPGSEVDQEYANLQTTLDVVLANLALIQDDDGTIAEDTVDEAALTPEVRDKLNDTGAGGGGSVNSVNGKQGDVELSTGDIPSTNELFYYPLSDQQKVSTVATGAQVNRLQATQPQAEAGVDNTTDMSPLRVAQSIAANVNSIPDYSFVNRTFDLTPVFDRNVVYAAYTLLGETNVIYGVPDASWINGSAHVVEIIGNGDLLTWDAEYIESETGLNGDIPSPQAGETILYKLRWRDSGVVYVEPSDRHLRLDGQFPMKADLDMGTYNLVNAGAGVFSRSAYSVARNVVYAANIQLDLSASDAHVVGALTGDLTLSNPLNDDPGRGGVIYLDNRAAHVVTMGANWDILDGQSTVFASKEVLVSYFVPYVGKIAYSIRELN